VNARTNVCIHCVPRHRGKLTDATAYDYGDDDDG